MRTWGIKSKLAQEFAGFTGTAKAFREQFADRKKPGDHYHRIYQPEDIRFIKLKMMGLPTDAKRTDQTRSLPPLINSRMSKGGTGKTTIAGNVASALAMLGHRVLMIDGDPQASLTGLFGINWAQEDILHVGELMYRHYRGQPTHIESAIKPLYAGGMLDLIASDITMANADSWLMGATYRESTFKKLLESHVDFFAQYDVIILDSAPSSNLLTSTFMMACKKLLAVVCLDGQSLKAMEILVSNVDELNRAFRDVGFFLDVHIVANGYHPSYRACADALSTLVSVYGDKLNDTVIPHASHFMRQIELLRTDESGPVMEREPQSVGARAIIDLAKSLVKEYGIGIAGYPVA